MSKLNSYLKKYLEDEFDRVRKVPDFRTSDAAQNFFDRLKEFDRVEDDVIDPETGEVLIEKGETKGEVEKRGEKVRESTRKRKGLSGYLSRVKKRKKELDDDDLKEKTNKENPDAAFDLTIKEVADHFQKMGSDMAGDWLYDNKDNDDEDGFNFNQWVQSAAGDAADAVYKNPVNPEDKRMFKYLKAVGVRDINGWLADEIADGMMKERGPDSAKVVKAAKKLTKGDREKKLRNNRWGRIMGGKDE